MPEMMSWFVSGSVRALSVGSSRTSLPRASASLVSSVERSGMIAWEMTGSGKRISSRVIGPIVLHSVLPV